MAGIINNQLITLTILIVTAFHCADAIRIRDWETERHRLIWAPVISLKSPFMTFINDFNYPSWTTRHQMTKRTSHRYLQLPKDVPFAVICGACYGPSFLKPNLTLSVSDHTSESVAKTKSADRSFQYSEGVNECIMSYLITEPIKKGGTVTCTLYRGKQTVHERITFDAVKVNILEPPEEFEIQTTENPIELNCPSTEEGGSPLKNDPENPTMNVWYEEPKPNSPSSSSSKTIGSPIESTKTTIYIEQPKYTTTIVCSVYNIFRPVVVHQRRYVIQGQRSNVKSEYQVSDYDDDAQNLPPRVNLSSSILAIIILAAVVCLLLGFIGIYRFCAAARS